jgi:hypothetical protein
LKNLAGLSASGLGSDEYLNGKSSRVYIAGRKRVALAWVYSGEKSSLIPGFPHFKEAKVTLHFLLSKRAKLPSLQAPF